MKYIITQQYAIKVWSPLPQVVWPPASENSWKSWGTLTINLNVSITPSEGHLLRD